ncbi:MAG TPA: class I SAM-dependent methyltransferase [Rhizomicrobium sp.]|nr:class I SAM-dependent methyltransferase [Rhizomicrobium sp.]
MSADSDNTRIHRDCPSCGAPSSVATRMPFGVAEWPIVRCGTCELVYLEWVPVYSALYDAIAWTKQHEKEEQRRLQDQPILARIDMATRWRLGLLGDATPAGGLQAWAAPGPVLDVGCARGKAFAQLRPEYIPFGVEIDTGAAAIARAIFEPRGGKVINADGVSGMAQLPSDTFSGLSLWSYLEHEAQPKAALEQTRRVLKKDGVALVKVPNFASLNRRILGDKWPGFRHPDHVQYFTPKTLGGLARACGFSVKMRLYGMLPGNDNMYAILRPV